jgi:hypothetical protein
LLPATRGNVILDAIDKQLDEDSRNKATDKSYPQPERIFPDATKTDDKDAQETHHGGEKTFQFHRGVLVSAGAPAVSRLSSILVDGELGQ